MTVTGPETEGARAEAVQTRGWVKALLALSLAANLAVGGLAIGAWAGRWFEPEHGASGRRDSGLGPLATAMRSEDWKAMRAAWVSRNPDLKRGHEQLRADYDPLLTALRADPFDAGALQATLATISQNNSHRLISATEVIGAYLATLTPDERNAYAARLEKALQPKKKKD